MLKHREPDKKNIAILVPTLSNGGAERVAADLSIYLHALGYRVFFFLDKYDKNDCYCHEGKEIVIQTKPWWGEKNKYIKQIISHYKRARDYKKYKKKYRIGISISFMEGDNLTNMLSDTGDKKILTVHSATSSVKEYKYRIYGLYPVIRFFYNRADVIIAVSKYVKNDLVRKYHVKADKIHVIYNSVDENHISEQKQESIEEDIPEQLLLFVGRLDDDKRPWIAVRIMRRVVEEMPGAQLWILGRGKNEVLLKKMVRQLKMEENIKFLGFQKNPIKYMAHAKLMINCSDTEAFPCTIVEAMATGLPAVAGACPGGIKEILSDGRNGAVLPMIHNDKNSRMTECFSEEEQRFANKICHLLRAENELEEMKNECEQKLGRFSSKVNRRKWKELLLQL